MTEEMIVKHVIVDRKRTPQQMLDATGRKQYTNREVVENMPHGEGLEADVYFFQVGRFINDTDLKEEYEHRGLSPVDPYTLAQINADDPVFADTYPNGTHWQDVGFLWCFAAFYYWRKDKRRLNVDRHVGREDFDSNIAEWRGSWWFAGVRK